MLSVSDGVVVAYMHNAVAPDLGKIGVLVALESTGDKAKLAALGKQLAMHVAATISVAIALLGAVAIAIWMPGRPALTARQDVALLAPGEPVTSSGAADA